MENAPSPQHKDVVSRLPFVRLSQDDIDNTSPPIAGTSGPTASYSYHRPRKGSMRSTLLTTPSHQKLSTILASPRDDFFTTNATDEDKERQHLLSIPAASAASSEHVRKELLPPQRPTIQVPLVVVQPRRNRKLSFPALMPPRRVSVSMQQRPATSASISNNSSSQPLSSSQSQTQSQAQTGTPSVPGTVQPKLEHDYSETEWWGWVILLVTWIIFVAGMGSCLDVWSWAWDVGETPYAPPEFEDDPTLPIVGYYPASIIMTGVMTWVWVTVAWIGIKYFRHAKVWDGDD